MKSDRWTAASLLIATLITACSSGPRPQEKPNSDSVPAWVRQPTRVLNGANLEYVGIGEDRTEANARFKAEAFALQDLANDCSFVPIGTRIQEDHFDESVGVLHRSFARVSVGVHECQSARAATTRSQIRGLADVRLSTEVDRYQKQYDPPEPVEASPLLTTPERNISGPIPDSALFVVVRQQLALAKEKVIRDPMANMPKNTAKAARMISAFEQSNSKVWTGSVAFSAGRPNWLNHQPSAVRDTVEERARLSEKYPVEPLPETRSNKPTGKRGGGRRRRQPPTDPSANPPSQ